MVIGRFFNVVGPRQVGNYGMVIPRFVEAALRGESLTVYDDGMQVRCFAHVSEIVKCVVGLMRCDNLDHRLFNIGSDSSVTIRDLARQVIDLVNPELDINYVPYKEAYGHDFEDVRKRVPDVTRLQKTLGFKPEMPLEQILKATIAWKKESMAQ